MGVTRFSACFLKFAFVALPVLGAGSACAATNAAPDWQHRIDCRQYEEQEQANLEALRHADPAIHGERLDSIFYSVRQNSCLASVSFIKRGATYSGIFDIADSRAVWTRAYRGTTFTPVHIIQMDWDIDEKIEELQFAPRH
jgi:hypothetical protein